MDSLWGVFWIIYYGFIVSVFVLVCEWLVSGMLAVDPESKTVSIIYPTSIVHTEPMRMRNRLKKTKFITVVSANIYQARTPFSRKEVGNRSKQVRTGLGAGARGWRAPHVGRGGGRG